MKEEMNTYLAFFVVFLALVASASLVLSSFVDNSVAVTNNFYAKHSMKITSEAFVSRGEIPALYTCDGENVLPPLSVAGIPDGAETLAIIVTDPDAMNGEWVHWVRFNIPIDTKEFAINEGEAPSGVSGIGSGNNLKYEGPCPPNGEHRYVFSVYALNASLSLDSGATKADVLKEMKGKLLDQSALVGVYGANRKK